MNYKAILQYEGTRYRGWQTQGNTENTIQGKLEALLTKMAGEPVEVNGSGRTDAGVHAAGQVISFRCKTEKSPKEICRYMNEYLPEDIAVLSVEEAAPRFHARLNAVGKTYVYRIWNAPVRNVFRRRFTTWIQKPLDLEAMEQAAALLCGTHDYRAFCSLKKFKKSTVRTIEKIEIGKIGQEIRISYTGDGFLYHMVRIMAGTLYETAIGHIPPNSIPERLASRNRRLMGRTAPPEGLYLNRVFYDDGEIPGYHGGTCHGN